MARQNNSKRDLYKVASVKEAKEIATEYLTEIELEKVIAFGLPEVDDRFHIWRVPLINSNTEKIGEVVIDAFSTLIDESKTTSRELLEKRLLGRNGNKEKPEKKLISDIPKISILRNTIGLGDSELLLSETPEESIDLVFTSPPYYNAKPEYEEYFSYDEYLNKMRRIIGQCYRVLNEGRFFVLNVSPVLLRRANRNEASQRIAVPFDFHSLFIKEGFDFIDDIIWLKPSGAGWATGRGRRFAADRNPLQYKAVPVTEYVLVYRKHTEKLIDWNINKHPNQENISRSKIEDDYERTNVWKIHPRHDKRHPAVFPLELAEKVIKYYSFIEDVVLDPFAGIGTVGEAAAKNNRRFVLFEQNEDYVKIIQKSSHRWLLNKSKEINFINLDISENPNPFFEF
jgi:DNA modification methylase